LRLAGNTLDQEGRGGTVIRKDGKTWMTVFTGMVAVVGVFVKGFLTNSASPSITLM
jgi:hypothetical protein